MSLPLKQLTDPSLCIVFAYAPAGLGHLRVTKALVEGLPKDAEPVLLPDLAPSVRYIHRFMSVNAYAKKVMEYGQRGWAETVFTKVYRAALNRDADMMEKKLLDVLKQRVELPSTLLVVATHFGIAHQIAAIKNQLAKKGNVRVLLVLQVTDDSPQKIWYVPNTNLIFTPSTETKRSLEQYGKAEQLNKSAFVVSPYPVSPNLAAELSLEAIEAKQSQASPRSTRVINIAIPISGAAVGLPFASELMRQLYRQNRRVHFHVVGKRTMVTNMFFRSFEHRRYVTVFDSHSDRQVVELYEQLYTQTVIMAEVTKPSEQAFKALLGPQRRGGSLLLFTEPVGRQEYDNLAFLRKHRLIPDPSEEKMLYDVLLSKTFTFTPGLFTAAASWRGLILPTSPKAAARFIQAAHTYGILQKMLRYKEPQKHTEVSPNGVHLFWHHVASLL